MKIRSKKQLEKHMKLFNQINKNLLRLDRLGVNPLEPKYRMKLTRNSKGKVFFNLERNNKVQLLLIGMA